MDLSVYSRAELKGSDHRPGKSFVSKVFDVVSLTRGDSFRFIQGHSSCHRSHEESGPVTLAVGQCYLYYTGREARREACRIDVLVR